jgi:hypothetical protein
VSGSCKWTRALVVALTLAGAPALADDPGDLARLLARHDVIYNGIAWERHEPNGRILLRSTEGPYGRTSVGEWRIEDGARCLRWTRAMAWECYTVMLDGAGGITFTDTSGNVSTGRLVAR